MEYVIHILILIAIYVILSESLNLIAGYAGILSIAHAAFYGVGAYVASLMALKLACPFPLGAACAVMASGTLGAVVGIPSLRIRDDYFVIATFAFQIIAFSIMNNWVSVTGGPMGLSAIPQPVILGWSVSESWEFLILAVTLAAFSFWVCRRIVLSPVGRALKGLREDEAAVTAMGKNVFALKVMVFVVGSALAGLAGVLYAHYISFIDPTSFTVNESIFIISIVIIGGAGSTWGPLVGAVVLVSFPEVLRFVGMPANVAANVRQILYGVGLVVCMMWRPQGLVGQYSFRKEGGRE